MGGIGTYGWIVQEDTHENKICAAGANYRFMVSLEHLRGTSLEGKVFATEANDLNIAPLLMATICPGSGGNGNLQFVNGDANITR